jgi:hypothetical protein
MQLIRNGASGSVVGLGQFATNRKDAGSIPDVITFFNLPHPYSSTIALSSTQPVTEMNTRTLSSVS